MSINILLSTLFSYTLSLFSLRGKEANLIPIKRTGKIVGGGRDWRITFSGT
jgi:hypothetical protein